MQQQQQHPAHVEVTFWDITKEFSRLACIGFGGPAANIVLFEKVRALHGFA